MKGGHLHAPSGEKMMQFGVLLFLISACLASFEDVGRIEEEGYYKREHSLVQPYHGKL